MPDQLQSFLFQEFPIRGSLLHMDESLKELLLVRDYPPAIKTLLTEAVLAVLLLSHTLKAPNSLSMQLQCPKDSKLRLLLVQCDYQQNFRCLADWREEDVDLKELLGKAQMVFTYFNENNHTTFQSVVEMTDTSLSKCLEHYFLQSEQIATNFYLFQANGHAAGLLLQSMPDVKKDGDDWQRLNYLAATLTEREIFSIDNQTILHRLFHEDSIEIFSATSIVCKCKCSLSKMAAAVKLLGRDDAEDLLKEYGVVEVICDFCNKKYNLDKTDLALIFADTVITDTPKTRQ